MKFGPVALSDGHGAILAHTHRLPDGVLHKGSVLDAKSLAALATAGRDPVIAARLEPGDLHEDAAAAELARALVRPGLRATRAHTGRVNLLAEQAGLFLVDRTVLDRLNGADEGVTVATLADQSSVAANDTVVTIKIIPFAVSTAAVALAVAAGNPLGFAPYRPRRVGLVMTTLPGLKASILDGTAAATAMRIAAVGGTLDPPVICAHEPGAIAAALRGLDADILLVAGASATVDRRDVGPAGIVAAGGRVVHFGMPADPGNLICLCELGGRPALVLPGCARSPKLNGIDLVLRHLFAGLPVDSRTMAGFGLGGLMKDAGMRPHRRAAPDAGPRAVAAIVLAAGQSSRMAPQHKLLLPDASGRAMIARVVDHVLASPARPVIVVTGHRADEVRNALAGRAVTFVHASDYADGLSASLRAGIAALPAGAGALVCLGDMPLVTGAQLTQLIDAYDPEEGRSIVAPVHAGRVGNPVLWGPAHLPEIAALTGDAGARRLLDRHADAVTRVDLEDDAVLRDFDTVESLTGL